MSRLDEAVEACRIALAVAMPIDTYTERSNMAKTETAITPILKELCDEIDILERRCLKRVDEVAALREKIERFEKENK